MFNRIEIIDCYFALAKLGAVAVPVNFRFVGPEIAYVVDNSDSIALIFESPFEKIIDAVKEQMPQVKHYIAVSGPGELSYPLNYDRLLHASHGLEPLTFVSDNDPAHIMYTSGTTGKPKGAVLTHKRASLAT